MPFAFKRLALPEVVLVSPKVFPDDRGYFLEIFKSGDFAKEGLPEVFVQDNCSRSKRGVVRGLHFQKNPSAQGKLVQCLRGRIFDVAVDLRKGSPSYGKWVGEFLDEENHHMGKFVTKEQLAAEACEVEIERLGEPIGKQDQYACAFGGLNVITFNSNGTVGVEPIHLRRDTFKELQSNLLIFYTGQQRQASGILAEQKDNLKAQDKRDITKEMVKLVWKLRESLLKNRIDDMLF